MSGTLWKDKNLPEGVTKAELDFIANKERDLQVYGHYIVTVEELEKLNLDIEQEEHDRKALKRKRKK